MECERGILRAQDILIQQVQHFWVVVDNIGLDRQGRPECKQGQSHFPLESGYPSELHCRTVDLGPANLFPGFIPRREIAHLE